MELIFATHNAHKAMEVASILSDTGIRVRSLEEIGYHEEIIEDGDTLEANAWIKAKTIYDATGLNVVADDTGLEVCVLDNAPGVFSARYAGPAKDSEANMERLLQELQGSADRGAQFRTAIACIIDGKRYDCEGIVKGTIINQRRGKGGFGYDPIFMPDGYKETFGELLAAVKNKISHRARAFQELRKLLKDI